MGVILACIGRDEPIAPSTASARGKRRDERAFGSDSPGSVSTPTIVAQSDLEELLPSDSSGGNERYGWAVAQGPRPGMEDAVEVIANFDDSPPTELYAVYDGHSGTAAVEFVKRSLPSVIRSHEHFRETESGFHAALQASFATADVLLLEHLRQNAPQAPVADQHGSYILSSGCVGTVVLVRGAALHVANLGDCRALLCEDGVMRDLTKDHRAGEDGDAAERERLRAMGVEVSNDGYLHGRISVSRAFGDWAWAAGEKCRGLICQPDVCEFPLTADAEFLAMGSDGIFEKMTTKEAGQIVRRKLRATGDAKLAAEDLVQSALKRNGSDNLSAVVVLFKRPPNPNGERAAPKLMLRRRVKLEDLAPPDPTPADNVGPLVPEPKPS